MSEPRDWQKAQQRRRRTRSRPVAIPPGPGQESVWGYPRPPRVEPALSPVRVELGGVVIAASSGAIRVLETAGAPVYYLPPEDVDRTYLSATPKRTLCEWKGWASYWTVRVGDRIARDAAWSYADPWPGYEAIRAHLAFYARKMDACWVGDVRATPQPGSFYGGWVTPDIVGPFKGEPGSENW